MKSKWWILILLASIIILSTCIYYWWIYRPFPVAYLMLYTGIFGVVAMWVTYGFVRVKTMGEIKIVEYRKRRYVK